MCGTCAWLWPPWLPALLEVFIASITSAWCRLHFCPDDGSGGRWLTWWGGQCSAQSGRLWRKIPRQKFLGFEEGHVFQFSSARKASPGTFASDTPSHGSGRYDLWVTPNFSEFLSLLPLDSFDPWGSLTSSLKNSERPLSSLQGDSFPSCWAELSSNLIGNRLGSIYLTEAPDHVIQWVTAEQ